MHLRWLILVLLVAAAGVARGQSDVVFGKDDAEFVKRLTEAGYADLAEAFTARMRERGSLDSADDLKLAVVDLALRQQRVMEELDPVKRRDELVSILEAKLDLIAKWPRMEEAQNERNTLPDVYRLLGEAYADMVGAESDPEKKRELKDKAQEVFTEAKNRLEERIEQFRGLLSDPGAANVAYLEQQFMLARYNLARTYYFNSKIYAPDEANRRDRLNKAVAEFEDFILDYQSSSWLAFEASVYLGFCHRDQGNTDDALLDYDDAIALAATWGAPGPDGVYPIEEASQDAVAGLVGYAVLQKVKLLGELQRVGDAKAEIERFFASVPRALDARDAPAIYAALANALVEEGDRSGASEAAQRLVEMDPEGYWGTVGRDILSKLVGPGGGISISPENLLRIAGQMYQGRNWERALYFANLARGAAAGTPEEGRYGPQALEVVAAVYVAQGDHLSATVAYDAVYELYPRTERAPEALYWSARLYNDLYNQERRQFFRKRWDERNETLAREYPESPRAVDAIMVNGQDLEDKKEWLAAADFYKAFKVGTAGYEPGLSKAAKCYFEYARELWGKDKQDDARSYFKQADETAKRCQDLVDKKRTESLDVNVTRSASELAFLTRYLRATIALQEAVGRPQDVFTLLQNAENDLANTSQKVAAVWSLRIQALQAQGKLDEACARLEVLRAEDPSSETVASAAGVLARALDRQGLERLEKDPKSREGLEDWKRAAEYYWLSVAGEFARSGQGALPDDRAIEQVAGRLWTFAKEFNGIPERVDSFVGGDERAVREPEYFEKAAQLLELLAKTSDSEERTVLRARCLGFLGRFAEAARVLDALFADARFIDTSSGLPRISAKVSQARPRLTYAFLDWGVADLLAGLEGHEPQRVKLAIDRFALLLAVTTPDYALWWGAKYYHIRGLFETGSFQDAAVLMRDLERTTESSAWAEFGYEDKLVKLRQRLIELGHMQKQASPPPPSSTDPRKNK